MRHLLLFSVLLLGVSWAVAQSENQAASGKTSGQETVQGCLSNSGGTYTLTAKDGKTFQLTGDTSKLNEHVGHAGMVKHEILNPKHETNFQASECSNSQSGLPEARF